jgi:hypothetical protein
MTPSRYKVVFAHRPVWSWSIGISLFIKASEKWNSFISHHTPYTLKTPGFVKPICDCFFLCTAHHDKTQNNLLPSYHCKTLGTFNLGEFIGRYLKEKPPRLSTLECTQELKIPNSKPDMNPNKLWKTFWYVIPLQWRTESDSMLGISPLETHFVL